MNADSIEHRPRFRSLAILITGAAGFVALNVAFWAPWPR